MHSSADPHVPSGVAVRRSWSTWISPANVLRFLLGGFAVGVFLLAALLPAWEANDEPDHVRNVQTLVSGRWYRIEKDAGFQPHQAPLYYLGLAGWQKAIGIPTWRPKLQQNPNAPDSGQWTHDDADSQRRVLALRIPSVLLGVLTVFLSSRVARASGLRDWGEVGVAAIVATNPRFVFLSAAVNNDTLAITLGTAAILFAIRIWTAPKTSLTNAIGLGMACGLLMETKLTSLPMVFLLLVSTLAKYALSNLPKIEGRKKKLGAASNRRAGILALLPALIALLIATPIFVSNQIRYGDPLASTATIEYFKTWIPGLVLRNTSFRWFTVPVLSGFLTTFWYVSGWNQFRWKAISYVPFWFLSSVGLLGLTVRRTSPRATSSKPVAQKTVGKTKVSTKGAEIKQPAIRQPATNQSAAKNASIQPTEPTVVAFLVPLLIAICLSAASAVWILSINATQWQGRLSFPGLSAFATLIVTGYRRLRLPVLAWFLLPSLALVGTIHAIQADVIARYF